MNCDNNMSDNYESESYQFLKKQKISRNDSDEIQQIYHGWYSNKFVDDCSNIACKNNNMIVEPKIHKYLTPCGNVVLVTHVSSNINTKPHFLDVIYVGEVLQYIETIYYSE